jgi:sulfite reductase alpha subunit-like flavoprotein
MIWIGAGTGIAPYRSFIQSRSILHAQGQQLGECILIAGCRKPEHDQLYAQEWLEAERKGLIKVYWAFSRNIVDGVLNKTYVQDVIESHKTELTELINAGANVYVCGDGETIGKAIPIALRGQDIIGMAQTGTGKTAAFLLPILNVQNDKAQKSRNLVYRDYGHIKGRFEDCEHRAFHQMARKNSGARIMISPEIIFN